MQKVNDMTVIADLWPENTSPEWHDIPGKTIWALNGEIKIHPANPADGIHLDFDLPEPLPEPLLLNFRARIDWQGGPIPVLAIQLNHRDLRPFTDQHEMRLVNQGEYRHTGNPAGYRGRYPHFDEHSYPELRLDGNWIELFLDISDLAAPGKNHLRILNTVCAQEVLTDMSKEGTLCVENLQVFSPPDIRRPLKPRQRDLREKESFIRQLLQHDIDDLFHYYRKRPKVHLVPLKKNRFGSDREWADRATGNKLLVFSTYPPEQFGPEIDWLENRHPARDLCWSTHLTRLWFVQPLVNAYRESGDECYAEAYWRLVHRFFDTAEKNYSPHTPPIWQQLSAGIRARLLCYGFDTFIHSKHCTPELLVEHLYFMLIQGDYLANFSRSPRNHGLMEAEGLAFTAIYFREFKIANEWAKQALSYLKVEFEKQVLPDGMHYELDFGYHAGMIASLGAGSELAELNNRIDLQEYCIPGNRFEQMYLAPLLLMKPDRQTPGIGDSDPFSLAQLSIDGSCRFPANKYLRYFSSNGSAGEEPPLFNYLENSGYCSMRNSWAEDAVWLITKCGPDGGWHTHYDNGTVEIAAFGKLLLSDSGNYTYSWAEGRAWYLQTSAHQTMTLDNRNSEFRPRHIFHCHKPGFSGLISENQSYSGMCHRRSIAFIDNRFFVILDEASGEAEGEVAIHWQFAPGVNENDVILKCLPDQQPIQEEGRTATYGHFTARTAFRFQQFKKATGKVLFTTLIYPAKDHEIPSIAIEYNNNNQLKISIGGNIYLLEYSAEKIELVK